MTSDAGSMANGPLAIVVVSLLGGEALKRTLRSLSSIPAPLVVVSSSPWPDASPPMASQAGAPKVIHADVPVPLKRALGLASTQSQWVAFVEDTCDVGADWHAAAQEIAAAGRLDAAGGPVAIASHLEPSCMALACLEYAAYAPPAAHLAGARAAAIPTSRLAGVNLLYRRSSLPALDAATGLIESELNERMVKQGRRLAHDPRLMVTYRDADPASATFGSRYSHGRIYGGGQRDRVGLGRRAFALVKCLALPLVLYARAAPAIARGCPSPWRTRAWIAGLGLAWSCGEFMGFLAGRGTSLDRWR